MDLLKKLLKHKRIATLKTTYKHGGFPAKKFKRLLIAGAIFAVVSIIITITLVVLLIRWLWNAGSNAITENVPTTAVVEQVQQGASSIIPATPAPVQDFLANGTVDTQKLEEAFNNIPSAAQDAWKQALEFSISQQIEEATGASLQQLEALRSAVTAL